jgi:hypothetical protein
MFDNYLIEIQDSAAGIVVRDGNRFQFFAVGENFFPLEGRSFSSPHEAEKAAIRHAASRGMKRSG